MFKKLKLIFLVLFFPSQSFSQIPIIYHENYNVDILGIEELHSFDTKKHGKVYSFLSEKYHEKIKIHQPEIPERSVFEKIHNSFYLDDLYNNFFNIVEIPFKIASSFDLEKLKQQVLNSMKLATGGTILGCELALQHGCAINLSGGYHHAKSNKGGGFCFFADIPIAVKSILEKRENLKILIVDLDAHHGDGNEEIFRQDEYLSNKNIYIFDIYNREKYPFVISELDFWQDVNLMFNEDSPKNYLYPVENGCTTEQYLELLKSELPEVINKIKPNLIIYNAGTDIYEKDSLGGMKVSKEGIIERDALVFKTSLENKIPIMMVLSGGYTQDSAQRISESIENLINNVITQDLMLAAVKTPKKWCIVS